ncbi:MAG: hypothetical protein Kow0059_19650 [Candidatus Sumerlaeia bacterium]
MKRLGKATWRAPLVIAAILMLSRAAWAALDPQPADGDVPTTPTPARRIAPGVEALLERVAAAWRDSQSLSFRCALDYQLKGTNSRKQDRFLIHLRARQPHHLAVKAYNGGSIIAYVYDGQFVFTHTRGNRFSKAPLEGTLQTLVNSGRLGSYPMILLELFAAGDPQTFLSGFDEAHLDESPSDAGRGGAVRLFLKRRREQIAVDLAPRNGFLLPVAAYHEWKFDPRILEETDPNLELHAGETYLDIDTTRTISPDSLHVSRIAAELMEELAPARSTPGDAATTPTATAAPAPPASGENDTQPKTDSRQPAQREPSNRPLDLNTPASSYTPLTEQNVPGSP